MIKKGLLALLLVLQSNAVLAEDTESDKGYTVKPMLVIGLSSGGDKLGGLVYEGGSSTDITAGGGATFGGGFEFQSIDKPISATATINYHSDSAEATNANVTMDRFEFTFIPYYQLNEKIQLGVGVSMHTATEYEEDFYGTDTYEFDSALATIIELRYIFESKNFALSGRFTSVDYEVNKFNGRSISGADAIDGSNVGVFFTWSFDK